MDDTNVTHITFDPDCIEFENALVYYETANELLRVSGKATPRQKLLFAWLLVKDAVRDVSSRSTGWYYAAPGKRALEIFGRRVW